MVSRIHDDVSDLLLPVAETTKDFGGGDDAFKMIYFLTVYSFKHVDLLLLVNFYYISSRRGGEDYPPITPGSAHAYYHDIPLLPPSLVKTQ